MKFLDICQTIENALQRYGLESEPAEANAISYFLKAVENLASDDQDKESITGDDNKLALIPSALPDGLQWINNASNTPLTFFYCQPDSVVIHSGSSEELHLLCNLLSGEINAPKIK